MDPVPGTNRVIVRRLELFDSYDPSLDGDAASDLLKQCTAERTRDIARETLKRMADGVFPRICVGHKEPGSLDVRPSIARVIALACEQRQSGQIRIVGDVEMDYDSFQHYIASNRYPRRSAEIFMANNHMATIALLGADAAARSLRETDYRDADLAVFAARASDVLFAAQQMGAGASTIIPNDTSIKESSEMDPTAIRQAVLECMAGDDFKKALFALVSEAMTSSSRGAAAPETPASGSADFAAADVEVLRNDLAAAQARVKTLECERRLDLMAAKGFRIPEAQRGVMVAAIAASPNPDGVIALFEALSLRDPVGQRLPTPPAPQGRPSGLDEGTVGAIVAAVGNDPKAYLAAVNARKGGA